MKTTREIAETCGVSEQAVRAWCRKNHIAKDAKGSFEISETIEYRIYKHYKVDVAKDVAQLAKADDVVNQARATRAVDEPTRRDADAAIEKRLTALRSVGQGREYLSGTGESAVQDIIREARAGIDRATAKEENSRTGRSDREAEQQRCDISTKSGIRETKHSIAKEHPKRPSRGRSR